MQRPQPDVDSKVLVNWNALAARGLLDAGLALHDEALTIAGSRSHVTCSSTRSLQTAASFTCSATTTSAARAAWPKTRLPWRLLRR